VWTGSGSGCSAYIGKPGWQHDSGCPGRTVADVAAVADPSTGVWVYDSTPSGGRSGWVVFGGTSVASPIVSAVYALAANGPVDYAAGLYAVGASLFDISSGSNGSCGGLYLCTGAPGYDGPTGNGSPNGDSAFAGGAAPIATNTPTGTPTPTNTPVPTNTPTATNTATSTSTPVPTSTSAPTSTSTAAPTATQVPQASYSSSATSSPAALPRGSKVAVAVSVTSTTASTALVDLEIYDQAGHKVYQKWWNNQAFAAGQPRTFNISWLIPTTDATGTYTVKIGIFKNGWSALYNWNNGAAFFAVT
jgi:hypothetical protein